MTPILPAVEVLDQAPDAILLVDGSGAIVYANEQASALFGVKPADVIGRPIRTLIPEDPLTEPPDGTLAAGSADDPHHRRLPLSSARPDGSTSSLDVYVAPIRKGEERWMLIVVRDPTERQRMIDDLRRAKTLADEVARTKGEFLALAAHDLIQPEQTLELVIAAIGRAAPAGSEIGTLAEQAAVALARMRELVRMLMDISRLEAGAWQVMQEPVLVADIFADLERQFGPLARSKGLVFATHPSSHLLETDPALLRGMLSNLVTNAIRYTAKGEVTVRCVAAPAGGLRLSVTDTGIGIPEEQLPRIFEDFRRLEDARDVCDEGFGLGLGIVRRLAALLGYTVTVQSAVGQGSIFAVDIPAVHVHDAAERK